MCHIQLVSIAALTQTYFKSCSAVSSTAQSCTDYNSEKIIMLINLVWFFCCCIINNNDDACLIKLFVSQYWSFHLTFQLWESKILFSVPLLLCFILCEFQTNTERLCKTYTRILSFYSLFLLKLISVIILSSCSKSEMQF